MPCSASTECCKNELLQLRCLTDTFPLPANKLHPRERSFPTTVPRSSSRLRGRPGCPVDARAGQSTGIWQGEPPKHPPTDKDPAFSDQAEKPTKRERKMLQTRNKLWQANGLFKLLSLLIIAGATGGETYLFTADDFQNSPVRCCDAAGWCKLRTPTRIKQNTLIPLPDPGDETGLLHLLKWLNPTSSAAKDEIQRELPSSPSSPSISLSLSLILPGRMQEA